MKIKVKDLKKLINEVTVGQSQENEEAVSAIVDAVTLCLEDDRSVKKYIDFIESYENKVAVYLHNKAEIEISVRVSHEGDR